ncbi:MAG: EAL domain-containing protein, partial [Gammaproteobacteria bacterium]
NHNHGAKAILEASVGMAKSMRMEIVAEGAENREDWDAVELLEVDHVQGYYCAKPMPNNELLDFMENWMGPHAA